MGRRCSQHEGRLAARSSMICVACDGGTARVRVHSRGLIASTTHNTIYIRVWGRAIVCGSWASVLDFGGSCLMPLILFPGVVPMPAMPAAQFLVQDKPNDANQSE